MCGGLSLREHVLRWAGQGDVQQGRDVRWGEPRAGGVRGGQRCGEPIVDRGLGQLGQGENGWVLWRQVLLRHDRAGSRIEAQKPTRPRRAATEDGDSKRQRPQPLHTLPHETPLGSHHPREPWGTAESRGRAKVAWICFHPQLTNSSPWPRKLKSLQDCVSISQLAEGSWQPEKGAMCA